MEARSCANYTRDSKIVVVFISRKESLVKPYIIVLFAVLAAQSAIAEEVVYDALPGFGTGGYGPPIIGQRITLEGSARFATKFELAMRVFGTGLDHPTDIEVNFYLPNGPDGSPGTRLWSGLGQQFTINPGEVGYARSGVLTAFPKVTVPSSFFWTITKLAPEITGSYIFSGNGQDFPTRGQNGPVWIFDQGDWLNLNDPGPLSVRITAVIPEPSGFALAAVGTFGLIRRRR